MAQRGSGSVSRLFGLSTLQKEPCSRRSGLLCRNDCFFQPPVSRCRATISSSHSRQPIYGGLEMKPRKLLIAVLAAIALICGNVGAARIAQAAPIADGYYVLAYSGVVYQVSGGGTSIRSITYAEWAAAGFPTPQAAPTDYVKYSWAPTISAVTYFDAADASSWLWQ